MNRKSISTSFNSDEIEAIDRVCTKFGITRGRLIKEAVELWMLHRYEIHSLRSMYPLFGKNLEKYWINVIQPSSKFDPKTGRDTIDYEKVKSRIIKWNRPRIFKKAMDELAKVIEAVEEEHVAYHTLAKKKKSGRPRNPKRKPGKPKR